MKRIFICLLPFFVAACGGGGGGGGPGGGGGYLRSEVPFSTPVKVATVDPLVGSSYTWANTDMFTANITGSGEDVIIAGRSSDNSDPATHQQSRIHMMSWQNGQLVDKTAQWFPDNINVIKGTEPSIKFADFFNTGRTDMFMAPSTDMSNNFGPAYVFNNQGTSFSRTSLDVGNIWSHDSAIADLNMDGFKDIVLTDYGPGTTVAMNNTVNNFNIYKDHRGVNGDLRWGGSSVAVADFLNNGTRQLIVTDNGCNGSAPTCTNTSFTKMYTWNIDGANQLSFNYHSTLPAERFSLSKWSGIIDHQGGHSVRAVAYDFNDDSVTDVIIFSRPSNVSLKYSEIQFLKNNGTGGFSDVTDNTLVGYNTNTFSTYNPRFIDLNGDGKTDILVSGSDFSGNNTSTQFLLKSSDGKYVAAHQNILTDFSRQVHSMQGAENQGNTINVLRGPDGKLYLISTVSFMNGTDRQLAIYVSSLGGSAVLTAQTAIDLIRQKWPYMTVAQANDALARTSATYFGASVIDIEAAMNPIGSLSIRNARGIVPINGFVAGVNLGNGQSIIQDSLGRSFSADLSPMSVSRRTGFAMNTEHIDQHSLTSHAEYLVNSNVVTFDNVRVASSTTTDQMGFTSPRNPQYSIGIPRLYQKDNWTFGSQYTMLNHNPWVAFGGAWGQVTGSTVMDHVLTYRNQGWSAQGSLMYVTTQIQPGLITQVSPMYAVWSEMGYRHNDIKGLGDIGMYAGIKPTLISGSVTANLPTGIDKDGNIQYTSKKLGIQNDTTFYLRAMYSKLLNRHTQLRINGVVTADQQYRIMNELRFWF
jgi:hypothetical protein